ncbi:MAG TPA: tryptophan--tRNA ligase [Patescibacteria group bacterium]|jgi:tryptophanyl-tRNA synthetase|nr:tryptophan--tRNA ligase [Patescibacteria group bacterium]
MKETIVSGIRASGKLHVGNYLGALKQFIQLQEEQNNCFFFIADLHAITTPFEPKELTENTLSVAADYLAAGIDPKKSTFFLQSQVLEHATLGWIFNCLTSLGELQRMTQFKDKSVQNKESVNGGLLTYPTLMAADILIYKPTAVPVGDDQTQHVELTRDTARKFNNRFGETFPEPKTYLRKPLRIMSLSDPGKKMSKTGDEALMLDDEPAEILRKLKKAVTATDANQKSSGVDNLFLLLEHFGSEPEIKHFAEQQKKNTIKYSDLKETLAKDIANHFETFREKKQQLMGNKKKIIEILAEGAKKAKKTAGQTLAEVKQKIGLI